MAFHRKLSAELESSPERSPMTPDSDSEGGIGEPSNSLRLKRINHARHIEDAGEEGKSFLPQDQRPGVLESYSKAEEKRVLKKLDRKLVLFMALLYMLSFLDRSNIGNARIAGLERDLELNSTSYEWLLSGFYIAYILFQWMALMYRLIPPHIYISLCVACWGVLASLQSISTSFWNLLIIRVLLGISEAAYGNGVPFYLSFFFRREELALRTGFFISAAPLATSFASTLAWVITKLGENGPIAPWRLLFLVEGFPSLFVAVFAWTFIPDHPSSTHWLTPRERKVAVLRMSKENPSGTNHTKETHQSRRAKALDLGEIWQTITDPKSYLTAFMFFSCNVAFSSMPVFLPTIVKEMGYTALSSQALSAPPYLVSFAVVLVTAAYSDRAQNRSWFIMFHAVLGGTGYGLLALSGLFKWSIAVRYIALYPACVGFFSVVTLIITWTVNNQESDSGKGTGLTILGVVGQCGPLLGVQLFPDSDKPYYVKGMVTCAGFMILVGVLAALLRVYLLRQNAKRLQDARTKRMEWSMSRDSEEDQGNTRDFVVGVSDPFLFML